MSRKLFFALLLCASVFCPSAKAQDCTPPKIVANVRSTNLFSPEQEMIFGDLTIQKMAGELRFVRDQQLLAYIREIGERLTKHLPETGLKFTFHLIDIPEANAFNLPGGHVLLSRKLVAFVNNEDELVGVMAHELGHAVVRHGATDISDSLRKILGITALADRKDVIEKYNLLIERARTKRVSRSRGHENEQQLEADKLGIFAMVAAGYDPAAFSSFFDRLAETERKTGNWFSDLFGNTRPEQKRLREMVRATQQLPQECREKGSAKATETFSKWQADVVSFRETERKEVLPGLLWKRELKPKLRSDVSHFAFSQDGKLLLAQDDFAITVIERDPAKVLFQIPIDSANEASFTPDGMFVVFTTEALRFEKWSVAGKKPVEVRELVLKRNCWEHKLSPDGAYLACVDTSTTIKVLDTKTGNKIWEKKEFYRLSLFEYLGWLASDKRDGSGDTGFFRIEFSPDSRFLMFSRSDKFRFRFSVNSMTVAESENTALALDLTTVKPTDLGGELKKISSRSYLFLDSGRVLGMPTHKTVDAGVFSFPGGKRLQKFPFAARVVKRTANPDYLIIKPLSNLKMGVFDLRKGIIVSGLNKEDGTLWNNVMAYEATNGKVLIREVAYNETEKKFDTRDAGAVDIPVSAIRNLSVAEVSDGFNWLLLSSKTRGGLWNLETGERKIYVRGFKGGIVADDGGSVGEFPRVNDVKNTLAVMNPLTDTTTPMRELPEKGVRQHGRFLLIRESLKEQEKKDTPDTGSGEGADNSDLREDVRFEVRDFISDKTIWTRDFRGAAPEFSFDEFSGRLIFFWRLGTSTGKAKLREATELQAKAATLGSKDEDYLVEVVDAFAKKSVGMLLLETGEGSFNVGRGLSEGAWLVLHDSQRRVLVYSIANGELRHRFFGKNAALNPRKDQIAVENFPGEVTIYDLEGGERQAGFSINGGAAFVRFNLDGNKLFVLSDTQSVYAFDLNKLAVKEIGQSH